MIPARRDLNLWRGNSETLTYRLLEEGGNPTPLEGMAISMVIDSDGVVTEIPAEIPDPDLGRFLIFLPADLTKDLTSRDYLPHYEIKRTFGAEEKTILFGNLMMGGSINNG